MTATWRAIASLLVFAGWIGVTVFAPYLWRVAAGPRSLEDIVAGAVLPNLALAIAFLVVAVAIFRWWDIGLALPRPNTLRLLWFPALYVALFLVLALSLGPPPRHVVLVILANTAMVGVSEELACRGVLYTGLRARLPLWPTILLTTLLFGAVHVLNGLATGDYRIAAVQAVAAFMTGIPFMALRLRTGSLYPVMVLHALWDLTLVTTAVSILARSDIEGPVTIASLGAALVPILFVLPNFLYGLYLLRHAARDAA
jgi:membrane protease YdiL (CAAX protease family)